MMIVESDDDLLAVVDKVNHELEIHKLRFVDDGLPHSGFNNYLLVKTIDCEDSDEAT